MPIQKIVNYNWKSVNIDSLQHDENSTDLIGIEECTDYENVTDDTKVTSLSQKSQKEPKSKSIESTETNRPKKTHKKRKFKPKVKKRVKNEDRLSITPSKNGSTFDIDEQICDSTIGSVKNNSKIKETEVKSEANLNDVLSWSNFGLPKPILRALAVQKFTQPTQIQSLTLPAAILGRRDILGAAETGSGKTLAFGLPILTEICKIQYEQKRQESLTKDSSGNSDEDEAKPTDDELKLTSDSSKRDKILYALILTPTRELAFQIKKHLTSAGRFTGIKIATIVGGMAQVKQERVLKQGPEIVVATPGRLWELIEAKNEHLLQLSDIRFLVIDETDRMIEKGHFHELHNILEKLNFDPEKSKKRQNFVFSATLTLVHELPKYLAMKKKLTHSKNISELTPIQKLQNIIDILGITDPKIVDISQGKGTSSTLTECRILCSFEEKDYYLYYFLQKHPGRTLIFCNSIGCVKRVTTILALLECHPLPLHAAMQQRQRLKNLDKFSANENSVLVATDVAARGLDIPNIEHVLHYQIPRTSESYVHRSGRTARASKQGITVLLMEPSELQNYLKVCRTLGKEEDLANFPVNESVLKAVKERVDAARELDALQLRLRKTTAETGWYQKAADEMDIIVDDDVSMKLDTSGLAHLKKTTELKRKYLAKLVTKTLFPKGFSGKYPMNVNNIPLTEEFYKQESAVDVMKEALHKSAKKKERPLYKAKGKRVAESELRIPRKKFKKTEKKSGKRK